MAVPIVVPDLGVGEQTIRVSTWFVGVGDTILSGDRLLELLIPGATFDLSASCAGSMASIDVREGGLVRSGDVLGAIDQE